MKYNLVLFLICYFISIFMNDSFECYTPCWSYQDFCRIHRTFLNEKLNAILFSNFSVDCVKIFTSVYDVKPIGFRLLHFNFVNSTGDPWIPGDVIAWIHQSYLQSRHWACFLLVWVKFRIDLFCLNFDQRLGLIVHFCLGLGATEV